jgi:hypothetical protein
MKPYPTAEEIAALFTKWGLAPYRHEFLNIQKQCGCAVGILLVDTVGGIAELHQKSNSLGVYTCSEALQIETGWPSKFINGLSAGFSKPRPRTKNGSAPFKAGFALEEAVWNLMGATP